MHDVIIIGGSFAGLAAATQLGRARRDVLVLDTSLPRNRFAAHSHGFFTRDGVPPLELIAEARRQLATYTTVELRQARAVGARRIDTTFEVELEDGMKLAARELILAHGVTDDLSVLPEGAEACWGKTIFFCPYCHGFEFGDRKLGMLLRHGDALLMSRLYREWSKDLTLFTNGAAMDEVVRRALLDEGVVVVDDIVLSLEHTSGNLEAVATANDAIAIDALFTHPPARLTSDIGVGLGCETKPGGMSDIFVVDHLQQTTVPGVFAAGDIARQAPSITFAVADGVWAGTAAHRFLLG
jgi:thioredoxin reductase